MIINNLKSLFFYVFVSVITIMISPEQNGFWESAIDSIIVVVILVTFMLIGRFSLKDTGSLWKNACSVILPLIIGLYFVNSVVHSNQIIAPLAMYYSYCLPFTVALHSSFNIVPYENTPLFGIIFVSIPSVLFLLGLQWQSRNNRHQVS